MLIWADQQLGLCGLCDSIISVTVTCGLTIINNNMSLDRASSADGADIKVKLELYWKQWFMIYSKFIQICMYMNIDHSFFSDLTTCTSLDISLHLFRPLEAVLILWSSTSFQQLSEACVVDIWVFPLTIHFND